MDHQALFKAIGATHGLLGFLMLMVFLSSGTQEMLASKKYKNPLFRDYYKYNALMGFIALAFCGFFSVVIFAPTLAILSAIVSFALFASTAAIAAYEFGKAPRIPNLSLSFLALRAVGIIALVRLR